MTNYGDRASATTVNTSEGLITARLFPYDRRTEQLKCLRRAVLVRELAAVINAFNDEAYTRYRK